PLIDHTRARRAPHQAVAPLIYHGGLMYPAALRGRLRAVLDPDPRPVLPPDTRSAAVLVPVVDGPEPHLVFTRRTDHLSRHAGEISFPGGLQDDGDRGPAAAALREAHEELGLRPT